MNRIGFLLSGLLSIIGIITLMVTSFTTKIIPKIGYMVYQSAAAGSYTPSNYAISFDYCNKIAIIAIIVGIVLSLFFYIVALVSEKM